MIADYEIARASKLRALRLRIGRVPRLLWAVLCSRLVVLAASAIGAQFPRIQNWQALDPTLISSRMGSIGNLLLGGSVRWDSIHYLSIASQGYKPAADTNFFPFYPLLIKVLGWVVGSNVAAGLLISAGAFAIALVLIHRTAAELFDQRVADATVLLLAFAPLSLFFTAIYSESVNVALAVATFYLARRGHLRWACLTAACAAITHVDGIALWPALAFMFWDAHGRRRDLRQLLSWDATLLLLPAAAVAGMLAYMHAIGFPWLAAINGANPTGHGHSIAPIIPLNTTQSQGHLVRLTEGPVITIWHALTSGLVGVGQTLRGAVPVAPGLGNVFTIGFQNMIYLAVLVITLAALVGAWRMLPKAYAIYAGSAVLLYTMSVVTVIPLRAFDRYMLPIFPLWLIAAKWLTHRGLLRFVLILSPLCLGFYTVEFTRWAMIA